MATTIVENKLSNFTVDMSSPSVAIVNNKVRVGQTPNLSSSVLYNELIVGGSEIGVNVQLVTDHAGRQHAGLWFFSADKMNWIRFHFLDGNIGSYISNDIRYPAGGSNSQVDVSISPTFSSKQVFKLKAVIANGVISLFYDGVKLRDFPFPYDSYGFGFFNYGTTVDFDSITIEQIGADDISLSLLQSSTILNAYSVDESGSFNGLVTQGKSGEPKLPLKSEVLLYDRMTNRLLQRTWSDDLGFYGFDGLDAGREYYAVTLHPNRTYNAVIQDGLKSGMTT